MCTVVEGVTEKRLIPIDRKTLDTSWGGGCGES